MIKIIIVEDEPIIAADLEMMLMRAGYEVLAIFDSGEEALPAIVEQKPDLLLFDIELAGKMDGVALAEMVNLRCPTPFLFITSYFDRATLDRVERVKPAAYIVKPFQEKNLIVNIELALHKSTVKTTANERVSDKVIDKIFVKNQHELVALQTQDVLYIEAYDNYANVFTRDQKFILSHTLKSIEEKLTNSGFSRIHKSYLINTTHISSIQEGYVFMSEVKLPLGKSYKSALINSLTII